MKAHKTHKSPLIICTESRGCAGSSGVLLYPSTDRSRATRLLSHHLLTAAAQANAFWRNTDLKVCSHWIKWDTFWSTSMCGLSNVSCQRFTETHNIWRGNPVIADVNSNTIYIFPIDPGKSYLGLALTISVYWSVTSPKCRSQLQLSVAQDIYIQGFLPQT